MDRNREEAGRFVNELSMIARRARQRLNAKQLGSQSVTDCVLVELLELGVETARRALDQETT
jgi:hypothetical protein